MRKSIPWLITPCVLVLIPVSARAKPAITLPEAKNKPIANLLPVTAPSARCAAVSDQSRWLAFGHRPTYAKAHVSLYRLDTKGKPATAVPVLSKLPRPAALVKYPNYPLGLAFHPRLPLLYVWQDIEIPPAVPAPAAVALKDFDHLLVYRLKKAGPELVVSLGRGTEFSFGKTGGTLAVDPEGKYLYVPNLHDVKTPTQVHAGRYDLDADGLPVLDPRAAKNQTLAARVAALNAAKAAGKAVLPGRLTPYGPYWFPDTVHGTAHGWVAFAGGRVLVGGHYSVMTWEPDHRKAKMSLVGLENIGRPFVLGGHPKLPVVFATAVGYNYAYRLQHADGHLTLLPQKVVLEGAILLSPPVALNRLRRVAFGGKNRVYVVRLDKKGRVLPGRLQAEVNNPTAEALAYSEKFDRLYVAVEVSK
jgi:hypothetical protein